MLAHADVAMVIPHPRDDVPRLSEALRLVAVRAAPRIELPGLLARLQQLAGALPLGSPLLVPPFLVEIR